VRQPRCGENVSRGEKGEGFPEPPIVTGVGGERTARGNAVCDGVVREARKLEYLGDACAK